jgi:phosphopentomutase
MVILIRYETRKGAYVMKRVFLIVLDSVGIGEMPDSKDYGDVGSNTIKAASTSKYFSMPNMRDLGFFNIDGVDCAEKAVNPTGSYARMKEASKGKDTTIGHWEISGIISEQPLPTFPDGFPSELLEEYEKRTGRKVICNKPYSGTDVIRDYGKEHVDTGALIVYTSADSVFQVAAHEDVVSIDELYRYCEIARDLCKDEYGVGRVIARPFEGTYPDYKRTSRRHDYSLMPPSLTMLDELKEKGYDVIAVGKINDIFAGKGVTKMTRTKDNADGIDQTIELMDQDFNGLCFINLVDFDMVYGHRNDVDGYAKALTYFDENLPKIVEKLGEDDILMITADHGCDPSTPSTDHSREHTPLVICGNKIKAGINLGTKDTFSDIAATILDYFNIPVKTKGTTFLEQVLKNE